MKKKLIILAAVLVTGGFFGYTSFAEMKTENKIDLSWELDDTKIEKIALIGAEQHIVVDVLETENEYTRVALSGKVSEDNEAYLKNTVVKEDSIEITLAELNQFRLMTTANGKEQLKLTVELGKNTSCEVLEVNSVVGDVQAMIQENFDGEYHLETNGQGEVKAVPETKGTSKEQVRIDTMGDITVEK
ncbi:hypothetical protein IW492_03805 [Enterococcus sp. BWB1-3]|uniref:hypothetical protein n=1 Tax=Enterococcus sp. BWB1-3 TaxID=2787713 RepID=UPI0019213550|nr:hypothetical protein [Enterococcus sp. BWB1-3]MBL1228356.1 hypothetical protein [Enterococcus sp. BWB1-3]